MQYIFRSTLQEVDTSVTKIKFSKEKDDRLYIKDSGQKILEIGLGEKKMTRKSFIITSRRVIAKARQHKVDRMALSLSDLLFSDAGLALQEAYQLFATQVEMANYSFDIYKSEEKKRDIFHVKEICLIGDISEQVKESLYQGQLTGKATNACRDFANTPGSDMTPKIVVSETSKHLVDTSIKMTVIEKGEMENLGMGGILNVARGSQEEPKLMILEYMGGGSEQPIVLVGKGVTFDTGGINLKPEAGILGMHMDMSGAAAVIHTIILAAKLKVQKNIVVIAPLVENMPSGTAYKPGDVLKTMSGITVEVLNTDAEGRLILADALTYARKFNPKLVVDVATLTGASIVALGERACAIFTKDERLERLTRECGQQTGDEVWPLPLWDEYEADLKSHIADIGNLPANLSRSAGATMGAMFLYQFAKDYTWMHIDMAPRMKTLREECLDEGASGSPVRLLMELIKRY